MKKKRPLIALLGVAAFVCMVAILFQCSGSLHTRLSLALKGCLLCHVEPPTDWAKIAAARPKTFVSGLVYKKGNYVGYLDKYGTFLTPAEPVLSAVDRETNMLLSLIAIEIVSGVVIIGAGIGLIRGQKKEKEEKGI